jgi:hypothetical protein
MNIKKKRPSLFGCVGHRDEKKRSGHAHVNKIFDSQEGRQGKKKIVMAEEVPTMAASWHRLALLSRQPSAATVVERATLATLARCAGLAGACFEPLSDNMVASTIRAHICLWEVVLDAEVALPWLTEGNAPFPYPLMVIRDLEYRGYRPSRYPRDMDFGDLVYEIIKLIHDAADGKPMFWPRDLEVGPNAAGVWPDMCALVVGTTSSGRGVIALLAPFDDSISTDAQPQASQSNVYLYLDIVQSAGGGTCMCADSLARALAERNPDDPLLSDQKRVTRALMSDRVRRLMDMALASSSQKALYPAVAPRPVDVRHLTERLGRLGRHPAVRGALALLSISLTLCTNVSVAFMGVRDLVEHLDVVVPRIDCAHDVLAQRTLRNAAAAVIARDPGLGLGNHTLGVLDGDSAALVAAQIFCRHPEKIVENEDLLEHTAAALGAEDIENPLGSRRRFDCLCHRIAFAIACRYGHS